MIPLALASRMASSAACGLGGHTPRQATGKWFVPYAIDHALMRVVSKILGTSREDTFHVAMMLLADKINAENEASGSPVRLHPEVFRTDEAIRTPELYKQEHDKQKVVRIALEQRFSPEDLVRLGYRPAAREVDPVLPRDLMRAAISGDRPSAPEQAGRRRARRAERAGEAGDHEPGLPGSGSLAGSEEAAGGK